MVICQVHDSACTTHNNEQLNDVMPGTRYPNAEEHPPSPPSKGEKRSEGGMLSLQRGKSGSEALGKSNISVGRAVSLT